MLITHGAPEGLGDRGPTVRAGCADLLARLRDVRPAVHLSGHIHQDGGAFRDGRTHVVNVTTWEALRAPTVLDVDPGTGAVALGSVPNAR